MFTLLHYYIVTNLCLLFIHSDLKVASSHSKIDNNFANYLSKTKAKKSALKFYSDHV